MLRQRLLVLALLCWYCIRMQIKMCIRIMRGMCLNLGALCISPFNWTLLYDMLSFQLHVIWLSATARLVSVCTAAVCLFFDVVFAYLEISLEFGFIDFIWFERCACKSFFVVFNVNKSILYDCMCVALTSYWTELLDPRIWWSQWTWDGCQPPRPLLRSDKVNR